MNTILIIYTYTLISINGGRKNYWHNRHTLQSNLKQVQPFVEYICSNNTMDAKGTPAICDIICASIVIYRRPEILREILEKIFTFPEKKCVFCYRETFSFYIIFTLSSAGTMTIGSVVYSKGILQETMQGNVLLNVFLLVMQYIFSCFVWICIYM